MAAISKGLARFPGRPPIDAYGNGGFRFANMSHRGSLLCLPSGVYDWRPAKPDDVGLLDLAAVLTEADAVGFLLLGTGRQQVFASAAVRQAFASAGVGLEPMSTGAACRTYNVMLAEGRPVAAALVAVD